MGTKLIALELHRSFLKLKSDILEFNIGRKPIVPGVNLKRATRFYREALETRFGNDQLGPRSLRLFCFFIRDLYPS